MGRVNTGGLWVPFYNLYYLVWGFWKTPDMGLTVLWKRPHLDLFYYIKREFLDTKRKR